MGDLVNQSHGERVKTSCYRPSPKPWSQRPLVHRPSPFGRHPYAVSSHRERNQWQRQGKSSEARNPRHRPSTRKSCDKKVNVRAPTKIIGFACHSSSFSYALVSVGLELFVESRILIRTATIGARKSGNTRHLVFAKLEVEHVEVCHLTFFTC